MQELNSRVTCCASSLYERECLFGVIISRFVADRSLSERVLLKKANAILPYSGAAKIDDQG